jgi:hypothetical protein
MTGRTPAGSWGAPSIEHEARLFPVAQTRAPFDLRDWLARELVADPNALHLDSDATSGERREIRYHHTVRGSIEVVIERGYHEGTWHIRASWPWGTAASSVAIDTEILP